MSQLVRTQTIAEISHDLAGNEDGYKHVTLVPMRVEGEKQAFFCVHPAGGTVMDFVGLARALGPEHPFYALQPLGLDGKHKPLSRVSDMASLYIREIMEVHDL